jgi:hypothetical protein
MRETFTSGSVGRAPGNRCLYPEADAFQARLSAGVRRYACVALRDHELLSTNFHLRAGLKKGGKP